MLHHSVTFQLWLKFEVVTNIIDSLHWINFTADQRSKLYPVSKHQNRSQAGSVVGLKDTGNRNYGRSQNVEWHCNIKQYLYELFDTGSVWKFLSLLRAYSQPIFFILLLVYYEDRSDLMHNSRTFSLSTHFLQNHIYWNISDEEKTTQLYASIQMLIIFKVIHCVEQLKINFTLLEIWPVKLLNYFSL